MPPHALTIVPTHPHTHTHTEHITLTHTHSHTEHITLTHTHTHTLSTSHSHTHIHTHTHTHTEHITLTHTNALTNIHSQKLTNITYPLLPLAAPAWKLKFVCLSARHDTVLYFLFLILLTDAREAVRRIPKIGKRKTEKGKRESGIWRWWGEGRWIKFEEERLV